MLPELRPTHLCAFLSWWFLSEAYGEFPAAESLLGLGVLGSCKACIWWVPVLVCGYFISWLPKGREVCVWGVKG